MSFEHMFAVAIFCGKQLGNKYTNMVKPKKKLVSKMGTTFWEKTFLEMLFLTNALPEDILWEN